MTNNCGFENTKLKEKTMQNLDLYKKQISCIEHALPADIDENSNAIPQKLARKFPTPRPLLISVMNLLTFI